MSLPASLAVRVSTYRDNEMERIQLGRRCEIWKQVSRGTSLMRRQPTQLALRYEMSRLLILSVCILQLGSCDLADFKTLDT